MRSSFWSSKFKECYINTYDINNSLFKIHYLILEDLLADAWDDLPLDALQALNRQVFVVDCSLLKKELKLPSLEDGLDLGPYVLYEIEMRAIRDIVDGLYPVVFEEGRDLLAPIWMLALSRKRVISLDKFWATSPQWKILMRRYL